MDRNPNSFSHRHSPHAIDYSDPFTRPPLWRKQVMLPFPPPPGYIQRSTYGISAFDLQTKRIRMQREMQAEESRQRSREFLEAQEEQRVERNREAEGLRQAKVMGAMSKASIGSPLTLEDRFHIIQDEYEQVKKEWDRETSGLAGAEVEARNAAKEAAAQEKEGFEQGDVTDPETPAQPRQQRRSRKQSNIVVQLLQLLIFIIPLILYFLSCPDGFRFCPCGIIKRPYRFLARNPALVITPVVFLVMVYWREIVGWALPVLLQVVQYTVGTVLFVVIWVAMTPEKER
ncbi:MAG: hypothetical protein Q9225_002113 [Loekoesia sp. 1 TL-2023]